MLGLPPAEGNLRLPLVVGEEDGKQRPPQHGIVHQPVHHVELLALAHLVQREPHDAVEGEAGKRLVRLPYRRDEIHPGNARLLEGVQADLVAHEDARDLTGSKRDREHIPIVRRKPRGRGGGPVEIDLPRGGRLAAVVPFVGETAGVVAGPRRNHQVAAPRVEDDGEDLRRTADADLAEVGGFVRHFRGGGRRAARARACHLPPLQKSEDVLLRLVQLHLLPRQRNRQHRRWLSFS
mmetsp:Transcript_9161/g.22461  ORF Transcript_9161/g.22461 Transcript_9161/m.22461 type:complete len:236 (-) Transcript_9161:338-1045(-)